MKHISTRTHLLMVFKAIFFRYFSLKKLPVAKAMISFFKKNYPKNISPKISRINMSGYLRTYLLLIFCLVCLFGCNEDQDIFIPDVPLEVKPSGDISAFLNAVVTPNEVFTINQAEEGGNLLTERGTGLYFSPNNFMTEDNQFITGEVDIEVVEIYSKGDMIKTGIFPLVNGWPLISIGQYFIEARQGEELLNLVQNMSVQFTIPLSEPIDQDVIGFVADTSLGNINWQIQDTVAYNLESSTVDTSINSLNTLGWINYATYLDTLNTNSINIEFPSASYNSSNTAVYVVFNDYNTVIPAQAISESVFSANKIPLAYSVKIISITEQNGIYFFSKKDVTISQDVVVSVSPYETSLQNILSVLDGL